MMKFSSEEDYKEMNGSEGYMKLQDGDNKFRILSEKLNGWEDWDNKRPIRFSYNEKPSTSVDPTKPVKQFWSFIVWNYNENQIQILKITQASIRKAILDLCADEDFGEPFYYDIKVTKKGEGIKTEYTVKACNSAPVSETIKQKFLQKPICLEALLHGEDPFNCPASVRTIGFFEVMSKISQEQYNELVEIIGDDHDYTERLLKNYKIDFIKDLPADKFDLVLDKAKAYKELE